MRQNVLLSIQNENHKIIGFYLTTVNYKLHYNLNEQFIKLEALRALPE